MPIAATNTYNTELLRTGDYSSAAVLSGVNSSNKSTKSNYGNENSLVSLNLDSTASRNSALGSLLEDITPGNVDENDLTRIKSLVQEAQSDVKGFENTIEEVQSELEQLRAKVEDLNRKLQAKRDERATIVNKLSNAQNAQERNSIQEELNNLSSQEKSIGENIVFTLNCISSNESKLTQAQENLAAAQENLSTSETLYSAAQDAYEEGLILAEQERQRAYDEQMRTYEEQIAALKNLSYTGGASNVMNLSATGSMYGMTNTSVPANLPAYNTQKAAALANAAASRAKPQGSVGGWCYRGVINALSAIGVGGLWGMSAYMAANQLAKRSDFVEATSSFPNANSLDNLPAGAIVVWERGGGMSALHGHISVALGNGKEASDVMRTQLKGTGKFRVFLPK